VIRLNRFPSDVSLNKTGNAPTTISLMNENEWELTPKLQKVKSLTSNTNISHNTKEGRYSKRRDVDIEEEKDDELILQNKVIRELISSG